MKKKSTFRLPLLSGFLLLLAFLSSLSTYSQCRFLNEDLNSSPVLSATNANNAWYPDRYRPAAFTDAVLSGNNVLKISIDGVNDGLANRPPGYQSAFYNTQGRKFNQCNKCVTVLKGSLWIPADWATDHRRSDMWATAYNASDVISFYPIIGFRNPDAVSPGIYYWNGAGWVNSGVAITYDSWYNLEFRLSGTNVEYLVNNTVVATVSSNNSTYFGDIIMQAYNFNDPGLGANQSADSYDAYWDNLVTTGTGGSAVTNLTTGESFCSIQSAINAPLTADGHTLSVSAATYTENITINKALTLLGPNAGIAGTGVRGAEAQLLNCNIDITATGAVVLDGFHIYQTDNNADVILISGGTAATIRNNKIERFGAVSGQIVRAITTSAGSGVKNIQHNLFTGDVSGGLFSGHKTWQNGIYLNAASSTVNISTNTFEKCRTAVGIDDFNSGISLSGNTFDNCGTFLSFGGVTPTNGQYVLGSNEFKIPGSAFINLSNVDPAFRLDITSSTFNGALFSTYPTATLFQVEAGMYHKGLAGRKGLVYYVPATQYVIPVPGLNTIQAAVDYAADGDLINIKAGNYGKLTAVNRYVFGTNGPHQFGLFIDKNNLTLKGHSVADLPVASAGDAAVLFTTGATNNFGYSGVFVQGNGVTLEGLKAGDNYNNSNVLSNNKTFEVVGDGFSMTKCWIATATDEGAFYMGRWDASHPITAYSLTQNKFENTLVSINNGAGLTGPRAGRLITSNEFTGVATPYIIGFRGWNGANPAQGWIVDPVGGAVITGNVFNNTGVDKYIVARGNAGGYFNSEFDWNEIWNMNNYGNKVITLASEPTFDPRTYNDGSYPETRRISPKIQENESIGQAGDVVLTGNGVFNEDVVVTHAVKLKGGGYLNTTISGPTGGTGATIQVSSPNVVIEGFSITRDGNNVTDWNNPALNTAGVAIQSQGNFAEVKNCNFFGNRTAIDVNNSNGNNIHHNIIDNNRTGLIFRNQTDNTLLQHNYITNNWTVGVLFLDASGGTNLPVQSALNSQFMYNNLTGNWYGDVVDRQSGGSLPSPGTSNIKNFECNWWGTYTGPTRSTANSTEPGYAALIPVIFGGTALPPAAPQRDILGTASANIDHTPWLTSGVDHEQSVMGFQPLPNSCQGVPNLTTLYKCGKKNDKKVYVCHNGVTICIANSDLQSHFDHGDILGQCPGNSSRLSENSAEEERDDLASSLEFKSYPNPFTANTRLTVELPADSKISIKIYDATGKAVYTAAEGRYKAGLHFFDISMLRFGTGIYYAVLNGEADGKMMNRTLKLIKQ